MACVAFRLFSRRLSPLGCFYGVGRLPISRFWRVSLSLKFHGVFHISLSIQCSKRVSLTTCPGMYHLQVVVMACVALRLAAFLALDVFRLVFITCVALRFPLPLQRVSLSGWFVYGIFCSQFSFRSLCHVQSRIWHLLLLFIQYVVPPFWDRFSRCVTSFVLTCGAPCWSCISHFLYFAVRVFFFSMRAPLHILQFVAFLFTFVVAYVFFSATSSSIRKFSSLFLRLFLNVIEVKTSFFQFISSDPFVFSSFIHLAFLSDVKVLSFHCQYARHVLLSVVFLVRIQNS